MAIFHYRVGERVSRGAGQSAVKVAAYQARERLQDERTGYHYNYLPRERTGIAAASDYIERAGAYTEGRRAALFVGLYAPAEAPEWCRGRENIEQFWSRAELAERQQNAQLAERIIIALPHELSLQQNIWLLQDHVKEFTRQGRVVQVAIHEPEHSGPGAERNIHAHLLVSLRGVDEHGFKASKAAEQQQRYLHRREYVQGLRARWAGTANRHLARHGHEARIDHRTLKEQGIERAPTIHLGPGDSRRERHGERSAAGAVNREIAGRNAERSRQAIDQAAQRHEARQERPFAAPQPRPAAAPERAAEVVDLDAWRSQLEQDTPQPAREAIQAREAAPASGEPAQEIPASDAPRERRPSPLYQRYQAERAAAWQARQAALKSVDERFAGIAAEQKRFYARRFAAERLINPSGPLRRDAMIELMVQQRRARVELRDEAKAARQAARDAHPPPLGWPEWLAREANRDLEAACALARQRHKGMKMPDQDTAATAYGFDAARTELWQMSRADLDRATQVDQVPTVGYYTRPQTIEDVAQELSQPYAIAAARLEQIRADWQALHNAREQTRQELERHTLRREERQRERGLLGHLWRDRVTREAEAGMAAARAALAQTEPRMAALGVQLMQAERETRRAFDQVRTEAARELGLRQERAQLAREVRSERLDEQLRQEREQRLERRQERGRGMSL
jgi:hypothetical protein